MDKQLKAGLEKAAPRVAAAIPTKASMMWSLFKAVFFPLLPALIKLAVERTKTTKDNEILRKAKEVLNEADL